MELDIARARGNERAVAFEELEHGFAAEHRAAAVEEQEYLELKKAFEKKMSAFSDVLKEDGIDASFEYNYNEVV